MLCGRVKYTNHPAQSKSIQTNTTETFSTHPDFESNASLPPTGLDILPGNKNPASVRPRPSGQPLLPLLAIGCPVLKYQCFGQKPALRG
ncbi:hypothetical protein NPIL_456381 [Nephila pilipes]|uniref:Uncharacterized protein n=1 Tax=Nephila pilipes TaxID=299642 RepID=A0A8X6TZ30_NEPPI|nr:hypothetical protein NPIL_456381 [Nephila pilipes]